MSSDEVRYCPRCGTATALAEKFGRHRQVCPHCGWIHFSDPKVAAAILVQKNGRILLVRRSYDPFRGLWTLPAGFVDAGEDPARAAERECLEETGLIVRVKRVLDVVAGREHPRGADFVIVYDAEVISGGLKPGDDADRAGWFDSADLPPLAFHATEVVLRNFL